MLACISRFTFDLVGLRWKGAKIDGRCFDCDLPVDELMFRPRREGHKCGWPICLGVCKAKALTEVLPCTSTLTATPIATHLAAETWVAGIAQIYTSSLPVTPRPFPHSPLVKIDGERALSERRHPSLSKIGFA